MGQWAAGLGEEEDTTTVQSRGPQGQGQSLPFSAGVLCQTYREDKVLPQLRLVVGGGKRVKVEVLSDSASPWTVARQASLSMGFSRQEYWSRLPFPSPGDLLDPGIEPGSPALLADS